MKIQIKLNNGRMLQCHKRVKLNLALEKFFEFVTEVDFTEAIRSWVVLVRGKGGGSAPLERVLFLVKILNQHISAGIKSITSCSFGQN